MIGIFYLDDYNLITTKVCENFLSGEFALYKDNIKIDYDISVNENKIEIRFSDEYEENSEYRIIHNNDFYEVEPRFITHTSRFEEEYKVDLSTLGSFYTKDFTIFRLWAPLNKEAFLFVKNTSYKMNYLGKGLFETKVLGNLEKEKYHYEVRRNIERYRINDPFAYSNCVDNEESYVIDLGKIDLSRVTVNQYSNPIIYELSVRDFSCDKNAPFKNKGKFLSLLEEGLKINDSKIGIDYIKELGITHLQLMPVLNFDFDGSSYNWGYNPVSYNSFQWDYVKEKDPYSPINEFKQLVNYLHKNNLRINLDVVYNHVYKPKYFSLHKLLPYYFFRYDSDDELGDASWCGNEIRSEAYFVREYFKLIDDRLINIYDIDGLRFDLMGVLDIDTVNYLYNSAIKLKEDFMFYGEGWKMGDIVPDEKKATIENAHKMPNIKFYSDLFRETFKGNNKDTRGYFFGDISKEEMVLDCVNGSRSINLNPKQVLNYVECHDNLTVYDKLIKLGFNEEEIKNISKSLLAICLLSNGIPFIHGGQEFLRSKNGIENSYNSNNEINMINWENVQKNKDVIGYFKEVIKIKKEELFIGDYSASKYYDLLILSKGKIDILINPTPYDYFYDNWITYKYVLDINGERLERLKSFNVQKFSLIIAIKE